MHNKKCPHSASAFKLSLHLSYAEVLSNYGLFNYQKMSRLKSVKKGVFLRTVLQEQVFLISK